MTNTSGFTEDPVLNVDARYFTVLFWFGLIGKS